MPRFTSFFVVVLVPSTVVALVSPTAIKRNGVVGLPPRQRVRVSGQSFSSFYDDSIETTYTVISETELNEPSSRPTAFHSAVRHGMDVPRPDPSWSAIDVVTLCMNLFLQESAAESSTPATAATTTTTAARGLHVCFDFSTDRCRAATGGSLDEFTQYADNPTFAYLVQCQAWRIVAVGPIIAGTSHRGSMQTVLTEVASEMTENNDVVPGKSRRFLWTLQQERRPPLQGCWMIHEVLYTKNAWQQTL